MTIASRFTMLNKKYKLKESVDVYTYQSENSTTVNIQFYKINTREKTTIEIDKGFLPILASLDGITPLSTIVSNLDLSIQENELSELFVYLDCRGFLKDNNSTSLLKEKDKERYSRQINYFDDLISKQNGEKSQETLSGKKVVIIGVGSTGGTISSQLIRAGVKDITIIDPKKLDNSHIVRHIYANKNNVGLYKVQALAKFLSKIDSKCRINPIIKKLVPNTDLSELISDDTDIVINTADEPYIGHITIKLGRYLWRKDIALYVSGGFDAHLMSSGELIYKGLSPCADCCANTFKKALADWKPEYSSSHSPLSKLSEKSEIKSGMQYLVGGAGGIFGQSLYSASFASMNIIDYLLDNYKDLKTINKRGEYLLNKGESTWFEMKKQIGCPNCE